MITPAHPRPRRRLRICISVDFDAISGYLGTGHDARNTLSDYSAGLLSANAGMPRLLRLLSKHGVGWRTTWFVPGHSAETFPAAAAAIAASGAEIGLHGYSHEGAHAMSPQQEADVLDRCIAIATALAGGRAPTGYRAPLYQIRDTTVRLLRARGVRYDSSMNAHDALPYFLHPGHFALDRPPHVPDYGRPASSWMHPTPLPAEPRRGTAEADEALVEIPASWYTEDMTPLGFYPYAASTQGYVSVDVVERMWWDRFEWLWENEADVEQDGPGRGYGCVYPLVWHPESAGRAHVVGMIDHFLGRLVEKMREAEEGEITFETMADAAEDWRAGS